MATILNGSTAFGAPGSEPRWTRSDKDGVGTCYSALSRVWFTVSQGILNEIYYPTVDRPQVRDLQYLVSDGETFMISERHMQNSTEFLTRESLGFRITSADPHGRFKLIKEVITDPYQDCLLIHTRVEVEESLREKFRLYVLLAPHLEVGGMGNSGNVVKTDWGNVLTAHKGLTWLALTASVPFSRCSCGYVGRSDGFTDLSEHLRMEWAFDAAPDGNIALMAEIDISRKTEFVLALSFGESLHHALYTCTQALGISFADHRLRFIDHWKRSCKQLASGKDSAACDIGSLYHVSHSIILAHEDKTYEGALIASLSIPWGEASCDLDLGGYHLVWTRDMCHSATGLLASGDTQMPLRALIYLACTQNDDGGFPQNFWINGEPHWTNIQLDEVALPVILAWRINDLKAMQQFDPYPMVLKAAGYLIERGPVTPQERWEENSGFSPSTLAAHIAALICAADFARQREQLETAEYFEQYADFLESHVEAWTVTTEGTLVPGISRHYIRMHPASPHDQQPDENANHGMLEIKNQPPTEPAELPAKEIVDGGFLELVRYGIRRANDPVIEASVRVIDAVLKVETPAGPCWRRYNHDGYGQRRDGGPFKGHGYGHAWPVLTGERGHYELAAGRDPKPYIQAMEGFASSTKLLPEQIWVLPDLPEALMVFGRATGGAMPLVWAHGEYIQLVRSASDGRVFDLIPPVAARYRDRQAAPARIEIWKFNRQVRAIAGETLLRVQAAAPFKLHWSRDDWGRVDDLDSKGISTGHHYADIQVSAEQQTPIRFTFFWTGAGHWEGRDFSVEIRTDV